MIQRRIRDNFNKIISKINKTRLFFFKFVKDYNETNEKLNESCLRFNDLKSRRDINFEDLIAELDRLKETIKAAYRFDTKIDYLYRFINKLPAFKMRRTPLKPPYDRVEILAKYSQIEVNKLHNIINRQYNLKINFVVS